MSPSNSGLLRFDAGEEVHREIARRGLVKGLNARACSDEIDAVRRVGKGGQDFCRIGTVRVPPCPRGAA